VRAQRVEATVIARLLIDEIISRHGAPRVLLSDRGTNFLSKVVAEVCKIFQIQKVNTSSYHPQTNGLVERFNSTLCQSLSMYVSKNQKDWDEFIPLILFADRTSVLDLGILLFTFFMGESHACQLTLSICLLRLLI